MGGYVTNILVGFRSLLTGLGITARQSTKKSVTLTYPHEKPELSEAYRSLIQLKRFDDIDSHDCVACMQCVKICPSFCIEIEGGKVEGIRRKRATTFEVDFALCSVCGLCVDVCPTDTLEYSNLYDEAGRQRGWTYDLLSSFREEEPEFIEQQKVREEAEAAAKAAKKAAADAAKAKKAEAEAKAAAESGADDGAVEADDAKPAAKPAAKKAPVKKKPAKTKPEASADAKKTDGAGADAPPAKEGDA